MKKVAKNFIQLFFKSLKDKALTWLVAVSIAFISPFAVNLYNFVAEIRDNTQASYNARERVHLSQKSNDEIHYLVNKVCKDQEFNKNQEFNCYFSRVKLQTYNNYLKTPAMSGELIDLRGMINGVYRVDLARDKEVYYYREVVYSETLAKEIHYVANKSEQKCRFAYIKDLLQEDFDGINESFVKPNKKAKTCGKFNTKVFAIISCPLDEKGEPLYLINFSFATDIKNTCNPHEEVIQLDDRFIRQIANTMEKIVYSTKEAHLVKSK